MLPLPDVLNRLAAVYGEPQPPPQRSILELLLFENVVYLADDAAREIAFSELRSRIGTSPEQIRTPP